MSSLQKVHTFIASKLCIVWFKSMVSSQTQALHRGVLPHKKRQ